MRIVFFFQITGSKRNIPSDNDLFVKKMNQKNLELTAKRQKEDEAKQKRGLVLRKEMTGPGSQTGERLMNTAAPSFTPFSNSRTCSNNNNGHQACSSSFFHHPASSAVMINTHSSPPSKFESGAAPRAMNYYRNAMSPAVTAISYLPTPSLPLSYAFPSPHRFMCSPPRQLPNQSQPPSSATAAVATQSYFAMCHHQQPPAGLTAPTTVLSMVQPTFSTFTAASVPPMPTFVTPPQQKHRQAQSQHQPVLQHALLPPSFNSFVPPPPSPFANFNAMPTPPLPSSLPQPNFFATPRADASNAQVHHQTTFIPFSIRPTVSPIYHPQFVLPLPPPPPPPSVTLPPPLPQQHQRDTITRSRMSDRRIQQQSSH